MAKRTQSSELDNIPTVLTVSKFEFKKQLESRIQLGLELFNLKVLNAEELRINQEGFYNWSEYNSEYLKQSFNIEDNEYRKGYNSIDSISFGFGGPSTPHEVLTSLKEKIRNKIEGLKRLQSKADLLKSVVQEETVLPAEVKKIELNQVFIVHGHDEEAKTKAARFIDKLGFDPIILHEQASAGGTIIEKIEAYSDVGFGLILYTPCDIGGKQINDPILKSRARQNVVFEHGYLIGKIGRKNVCALVKGDIETPNDISGVVYITMDSEDAWHLKVAKELRKAGYDVDFNNL